MRLLSLALIALNFQLPTPQLPGRWESGSARLESGSVASWELTSAARSQLQKSDGRLFPPQDLGLLEGPDRAAWQKPEQIMDVLHIADGSVVADIGPGAGWFTIRLAHRVGPNGIVYARDVQRLMLEAIRRRVQREGLSNVDLVLSVGNDQKLPAGKLDAVLVVDVYQEITDPVPFLRNVARALKPSGRIGVVNHKPGRGGPGPAVRVDRATVEAEARAAGLRVLGHENLPYQYLLVLGR